MSLAYVVVWLGPLAAQAVFQADLDSWGYARFSRLEAPLSDATTALGYDARLVAKIEGELEQARGAAGSLDFPSMTRRLTSVEQTLHAHPELPQAAWLMAERLQIEAGSIADTDPTEAHELEARARALEGPRVPAFGSNASDTRPPLPTERVRLEGLGKHDQVYIDGVVVSQTPALSPGEHHARVLRRGRAVWSGWISVSASTHTLGVPVPPPVACGRDDLGSPAVAGHRVRVGAGVLCPRWIAARPRAGGGIEVATCSGSWCGPLMPWTRRSGVIYDGPPQPRPEERGLPTWAGWLIAGAGAAAVTGVVLWQTGAFDGPEPGGTKWQFTGPGN